MWNVGVESMITWSPLAILPNALHPFGPEHIILMHPFYSLSVGVFDDSIFNVTHNSTSYICIIQLHRTMLLVYMWSFRLWSISIYDHTQLPCVDDCNICSADAYSSRQQCSKCVHIYSWPHVSIHSTILPRTCFITCTNLVMITSTPCDPPRMKWFQKESINPIINRVILNQLQSIVPNSTSMIPIIQSMCENFQTLTHTKLL